MEWTAHSEGPPPAAILYFIYAHIRIFVSQVCVEYIACVYIKIAFVYVILKYILDT